MLEKNNKALNVAVTAMFLQSEMRLDHTQLLYFLSSSMFTKLPTIFAEDKTPITMIRVEEPITAENYEAFTAQVSEALAFDKAKEEAIRSDFSTKSVRDTMFAQGKLFKEPYILSYHNGVKTVGCADVQHYRINSGGKQGGVDTTHEVKMGIYAERNGTIHVVVTPAIFEVDNAALKGAHLIEPRELGLVEYTINPFNAVASLAEALAADKKKSVILHFNDLEMSKSEFVYNNNGNNLYSCVTSDKEYVNAVNASFKELGKSFPERVTIISEKDKMHTFDQKVRSALDLEPSDHLNTETLFYGGELPEDYAARANAGRDAGDAPIFEIEKTSQRYGSSFKLSQKETKELSDSGYFGKDAASRGNTGNAGETLNKATASKLNGTRHITPDHYL